MENHLDLHMRSRPASDVCRLCDFGQHVHPFWPRVSPLLNEEPLGVLRARDALILCVPSMELLGGLRTHHITWGSSPRIC